MSELQHQVEQLIASQRATWEAARNNYAGLAEIQTKAVASDTFDFVVQFNPERARSTTAAVEKALERPCFLCEANRPPEQENVPWNGYEILLNPYPIFNPHLTIAATAHTPQYLAGKTGDMLALSAELPGFVLTFNGARSGASAPDHFHFQAVKKGVLPAEKELPPWKNRSILYEDTHQTIWAADGYLRPAVVVEGSSESGISLVLEIVIDGLKKFFSEPDEAQFNALSWYGCGKYTVVFFPRTAHRPRQYYAEDDSRFLFSPGAIDMAGVLITVREEDYLRTFPPLIDDLFSQVVPSRALWEEVKNELRLCLAKSRK